jgi:hypothetical protein
VSEELGLTGAEYTEYTMPCYSILQREATCP